MNRLQYAFKDSSQGLVAGDAVKVAANVNYRYF
jgi:hypothetical protein